MWRRVRLIFWYDQTVAVFSRCFLVCPECGGESALFSSVFSMSRLSCLVFWCVQNVGVCLPCFLVFQKVTACPPCFLVGPDFYGVSALFSGGSRLWQCVRFVFWWVQTFAVCPPCFLVRQECCGLSVLFTGVCSMLRCVRLVYWCV